MAIVTVAGANGTSVSLHYDSSSNVTLAQRLASAITAGVSAGTIVAATDVDGSPPPVPAGLAGEFVQTLSGLTILPPGYTTLLVTAPSATVFGSANPVLGQSVLTDSGTDLTFHAAGGFGSIAAGGGSNQIFIPGSDAGSWSLNAGDGDDAIVAQGSGNDTINAGAGHNTIQLGSGNDLITSVGQDVITAGNGSEMVDATGAESDVVRGRASHLVFVGGDGSATVLGGSGSDTFFGGNGQALVTGGTAGNNYLYAGGGPATLFGGGSGDQLFSNGDAGQALYAGIGNETLNGGSSFGQDTFFGGPGQDQIIGGQGDDTFVAGSGTASIDAAVGQNTFEFIKGYAGGNALVLDLTDPSQITIELSGYASVEESNILSGQTNSGAGATITLSDNTTVTFQGITKITSANFTPGGNA
jgi:Ca2+-binding RTX toxin-like protein